MLTEFWDRLMWRVDKYTSDDPVNLGMLGAIGGLPGFMPLIPPAVRTDVDEAAVTERDDEKLDESAGEEERP